MPIRSFKPTSPAIRGKNGYDFSDITAERPYKPLTAPLKRTGGRNFYGRVTSRGIGGGHKKKYRIIDFRRDKLNISAKVVSIEYDPNRTCRIALVKYDDGQMRYILCPLSLKVGDMVISGPQSEIKVGNSLPLENIPPGIPIHNVEFSIGHGGKIARSAGDLCTILAKEGQYAHIRMPSGEIRLINTRCYATIGQVGNIEHNTVSLGKAGRSKWMGRVPVVRAVARNPVDHPMGGGQGKTSGGRQPCSRKGQYSKGLKTRRRKITTQFILRGRNTK